MSIHKNNKGTDKIFNNHYNTGELDDVSTEVIAVSEIYKRSFLNEEYNSDRVYRLKQLCEEIYTLLEDSEMLNVFKKGKIAKADLPVILEYLLPALDKHETYTFTEKFSCLCDTLDTKEVLLWESLPLSYKDQGLTEASNYTNVEGRHLKKKLF